MRIEKTLAAVAAKQHGLITRHQALRAGASRWTIDRLIKTGRWVRIYPSVYRMAGAPEIWRTKVMAVCLAGRRAVASHRSAAVLLGLPGFQPGVVEVTIPHGKWFRAKKIKVHQSGELRPDDLTTIDGISVTNATRTIIDLAAVMPMKRVEESLHSALSRGLTSIATLKRRITTLPRRGRHGVGVIRELLEITDGRPTETVLETDVLRFLRRYGFPKPACQYQVWEGTILLAEIDFAYPEAKVALEADGYVPHSGRGPWEYDRTRGNTLVAKGWRILRVTKASLNGGAAEFCGQLAEALALRRDLGRRPSVGQTWAGESSVSQTWAPARQTRVN